METIWPILLIIFTVFPLIRTLLNLGEPINLKLTSSRIFTVFVFNVLTFILVYLCGFFAVISWPQIVWIILTSIGMCLVVLICCLRIVFPGFESYLQVLALQRKPTYRITFADVFSLIVIFIIYFFGGVFHVWM
jgi:hypothetical protein